MKQKIMILLILCMFLVSCTAVQQDNTETTKTGLQEEDYTSDLIEAGIEEQQEIKQKDSWLDVELKDVKTGNTFKISDFKGKPVLIESFAVWCSICKLQQDEIKDLHKEIGDSVISISLNTDPNEEESQVIVHQNRYNYDWYFAVSPVDLTRELIDIFGTTVVNAPRAPVVLVCEDQSTRLLKSGVKSPETLKAEIAKGC